MVAIEVEEVLHATEVLHGFHAIWNTSTSGGVFRNGKLFVRVQGGRGKKFALRTYALHLRTEERSVQRHGSFPSASTSESVYFT